MGVGSGDPAPGEPERPAAPGPPTGCSGAARVITREYVGVDGQQVHMRRCGTSGAVVVLLHHAPSTSRCWDALLPDVAGAGFRAIALDLPGFGESDGPATRPDLGWYADRTAATLIALGIGSAVVVGRQTGAAVAAALAVRNPSLVESLVLWGYPVFDEPLRSQLAQESTNPLNDLAALRAWVADLRAHDELAGDEDYVRAAVADYLHAGRQQHWAHNAVGNADLAGVLRSVIQPIVLAYDLARIDMPAQQRAVERARAIRPDARMADIPGLSSTLPARAVAGFCAVLTAAATSSQEISSS